MIEEIPEKTDFWIRIPQNVLYAEGEKFQVLVDGVNTKYNLMRFPNDYVIGLIILDTTKNIEIIGTRVIPEFGTFTVLILGISLLGLVYFVRKLSLCRYITRIN